MDGQSKAELARNVDEVLDYGVGVPEGALNAIRIGEVLPRGCLEEPASSRHVT